MARRATSAVHAVFDIPSGRYFPARGFFVAGGRPSPSLFLGRTNFLGGISAGSSGGGDVSGGWIGENGGRNGWDAAG
jgi:hypothetical protein